MLGALRLLFLVLAVAAGPTGLAAGELNDAAQRGDVAAVDRLLASGGNINEREPTGETPLISAALAGQNKVVTDLLRRGADITVRNNRGLSAINAAAYAGDLESVKLLIAAGADLDDANNHFKVTPLILASEANAVGVVSYLLDKGARIENTERAGYTALSRAGFKWKWDAVTVLLKAGAVCQPKDLVGSWYDECVKRKAATP